MASSSSNAQPEWVWDVEFECYRKNGILFPIPIRSIPPPPPPPPPSEHAGPSAEQQQRHEAEASTTSNEAGVRRKRSLVSSYVLDRRLFSFKLFHFEDTKKNILAMIEVGTENTIYYDLSPYVNNGKKKLDAREINIGNRVISPVVGEIYEKVDDRIKLTIEQRLEGIWSIELRRRNGTNKTERFYSHEKVDRTFRSMNEVATFIGYNVAY